MSLVVVWWQPGNDKVLPRVGRDVQEVGTVTGEERLFCAWGEHTSSCTLIFLHLYDVLVCTT